MKAAIGTALALLLGCAPVVVAPPPPPDNSSAGIQKRWRCALGPCNKALDDLKENHVDAAIDALYSGVTIQKDADCAYDLALIYEMKGDWKRAWEQANAAVAMTKNDGLSNGRKYIYRDERAYLAGKMNAADAGATPP